MLVARRKDNQVLINTIDMTVTNAGTIRLALAFKKFHKEKLLFFNPLKIIEVIKKPDITKKTSTPANPPGRDDGTK